MPSPARVTTARTTRCAVVGAAALLLLAVPAARAQVAGPASAPREEVRAEIVAQVGAVRRLRVLRTDASMPARGTVTQRAEVEVASNVGCRLMARGTGDATVRLSLGGGGEWLLRAGEVLELRALPPGVHRVVVSFDGALEAGGGLPAALELGDAASGAIAALPAPAGGRALGSE